MGATGVETAVATLLRDGDPARTIDGLSTLFDMRLHDDADPTKRSIFVGEEEEEPDQAVTVFLEGGGAPIGGGQPNAVGRQPGFTVRTRAASYATAQEIAHAAHAILDYYEGTVHGVPFFRIFATFEPIPLGRDRSDRGGRWIFSQTFRSVTKRFVPS